MGSINYLDLTLQEFLDVITDTKDVHIFSFVLEGETVNCEATLDQITDFIWELKISPSIRSELLKKANDIGSPKFQGVLNSIEIYNYLEKVTSSFDTEKIKLILFDIDCYYNLTFLERINQESLDTHIKNGWNIPYRNLPSLPFGKDITVPDYKKMKNKTHIADGFFIIQAMSVLKKKLKESGNAQQQLEILPSKSKPSNSIDVFSDLNFDSYITESKQLYILRMLEDLSITVNGNSILSNRKKSAIRGIVEALIDTGLVPNLSLEKHYKILGDKIGLKIHSKLDTSSISSDMKKKAIQYINLNPLT